MLIYCMVQIYVMFVFGSNMMYEYPAWIILNVPLLFYSES